MEYTCTRLVDLETLKELEQLQSDAEYEMLLWVNRSC